MDAASDDTEVKASYMMLPRILDVELGMEPHALTCHSAT